MNPTFNLLLFDYRPSVERLKPFTFTRPLADIRIGIVRISQKWRGYLPCQVSYLTREYLAEKYPPHYESLNYYVNGAICATPALAAALRELGEDQVLMAHDMPVAFCSRASFQHLEELEEALEKSKSISFEGDFTWLKNKWDIFQKNRYEMELDFKWLTHNRQSFPIEDPHTVVYGQERIFLEEGATVKAATLNAENGPIYLGKNSMISEGAMVRGALSLAEGAIINMGAKMRGDTSVGEYCKVGGEVSNSVIFGYSNKSHDGYLGNSVLGEWCNLGADTNNSNLKNNYSSIRIWDYATESFEDTGLQFCGLMMGDHAKSGINTMFNTGTVAGVGAVIFGGGFMSKFIPSFAWGGKKGEMETYDLDKMESNLKRVMGRKRPGPLDIDLKILAHVHKLTAKYRR